jgi:hypothetical protein
MQVWSIFGLKAISIHSESGDSIPRSRCALSFIEVHHSEDLVEEFWIPASSGAIRSKIDFYRKI